MSEKGFKTMILVVCQVSMTKSCEQSVAMFSNFYKFTNYFYSNNSSLFCQLNSDLKTLQSHTLLIKG